MTQKFNQERPNNPRLYDVGLIFVETISKLLSRLLDYRSVILSEDNINNRMSCTVNILVRCHQNMLTVSDFSSSTCNILAYLKHFTGKQCLISGHKNIN